MDKLTEQINLKLEEQAYNLLLREAEHRGVTPAQLGRACLRLGLELLMAKHDYEFRVKKALGEASVGPTTTIMDSFFKV